MKRKLLIGGIIYILALAIFAVYSVSKGGSNYFGYKKHIASAKENLQATLSSNSYVNSEQPQTTLQPSIAPQPSITPQPSSLPQASAAPANPKGLVYSNISFTKPLKKGMRGDDVKKLQELLISKEMYNGSITGTFGTETEAAVKKYQKSIKVAADGVVGSSTWNKLLE